MVSIDYCLLLCTKSIKRHQKGQRHPKYVCQIQPITVPIDGGKLFGSIGTLSNIYLAKFPGFFMGETKLQSINISSALKLCIVDIYLDIKKQDLYYILTPIL